MECPYCKANNREGIRYCSNCGHAIATSSTTLPGVAGGSVSRSLAAGARLQGGRYVVKKVLGQGGMGAALLATDVRLDGKLVVIKELLSEKTDEARRLEDVRNFKREVSTLAHIDHPLVPSVTDHFQEGIRYFMVQEYVEGENLEERLEHTGQPMNEREVLICASEMLDVLNYLAQQTPPIVHRDIKPANIIISTRDKRAHLVDFGIARADVTRNAQRKQTAALGTPGYAPPEQYQGNADPRSDLYALAATLHHVLTGSDPRNHAPFSYMPVSVLNPQLSPEIERLLEHALQNDLNQRYQSAGAMKQDIDGILRQRFGLSGNIDSYILGTSNASGTSGAMQALTSGTIPTVNPLTAITPVQPLAATRMAPSMPYPGSYAMARPPAPPLRRRRMGKVVALLLLLAVLMCGTVEMLSYLHKVPWSVKPGPSAKLTPIKTAGGGVPTSGLGVVLVGNERIGVSEGSYAFDTTLDDGDLKTQAAQDYQQNSSDSNRVVSLLNQGVAKSANDAESLIYLENIRVQNSGSAYITMVVATMLSGDKATVTVGRDNLQGAYTAQKEFNAGAKLHGGTQLRLLIASSGSKQEYVAQVAQQIVKVAHADPTFVGVMGWPYSSRTLAAIKTLAVAHIPVVSQTASSDLLTRASPYFFRVVPSNNVQGVEGAHYAEQKLNIKKIALFYDPEDSYSQSLAQDFARQFTSDGNAIVVEEKYTVGRAGTLPGQLQDALSKGPDAIYFAGYANDLGTLLTDLPVDSSIPVLGGDALYELGGYPASASAGFKHLHFTAFAYPDEWGVLNHDDQKPAFFKEYADNFNGNGLKGGGAYGFTRPDNDAILSYDATVALLKGCDLAYNSGKQTITTQDLQQALLKLNGANAFQGVSGQIALGSDGDPIEKAIVVLYVDNGGHIHMESALGRFLQ